MPRIPYLEHVIILCTTDNTKKDSPFDIAECLIEISRYFKERSRNIKIAISVILPGDECWSVNRIVFRKINAGSVLLTKNIAGPGKIEC